MNTSEIPAWESLAAQPLDARDEQILTGVARLFERVDPVPDDLVERLQFAITLDALQFEIAQLQLMPQAEMAGRGGGEQTSAVKTLTFTSDSLTTMVTISADGPDRVRIDGWAAPGGQASVELNQSGESRQVIADEDGRFVFADVEHGLTRFIVRAADGSAHPPVVTPAVEI
ncbi:MAG: carboxypeptidase regulatory-like domain-containing protein [Jatrophihabitantaceae bacterium]